MCCSDPLEGIILLQLLPQHFMEGSLELLCVLTELSPKKAWTIILTKWKPDQGLVSFLNCAQVFTVAWPFARCLMSVWSGVTWWEVIQCFGKPHNFPEGTRSPSSSCLWIYACCLVEICVWPLGIFECERKSLLPNSWKYESLCDGEEQMRSWGLFWHSSGGWPQTECGLGWWMREVVVLGWRSKVAKRSGHTCYLQGHTHSWCICMTDCRQTVVFK